MTRRWAGQPQIRICIDAARLTVAGAGDTCGVGSRKFAAIKNRFEDSA
jgi:hypothetical protein